MARTRAQRRRSSSLLTVALVATLLVLLFTRDVTRSAHGAASPRQSENRSFAQMANGLIDQENGFDRRLATLLNSGQTLSRPTFAARLDQLARALPDWATQSGLLRRPNLAHNVNGVLADLTQQRVEDYQSILNATASTLNLPWTPLVASTMNVKSSESSLLSTSSEWGRARWSLVGEPGRATLRATTSTCAHLDVAALLNTLGSAPRLVVTRDFGISAVLITPAPLPAPPGELVLPPVTSLQVGVTVTNAVYVLQPVTVTLTFTPARRGSPVQRQVLSARLGPSESYAFNAAPFTTEASERATLVVSVMGAPHSSRFSASRTYRVVLSPSGNA